MKGVFSQKFNGRENAVTSWAGATLLNQIQQWKQVDPNQVDQVPVQSDVVHRTKVLFIEVILGSPNEQPSQYRHTTQDVH